MNHNSANAPRRAQRSSTPSQVLRERGASQPVPSDALDSQFTPRPPKFTSSAATSSQNLSRRQVKDSASVTAPTHSGRPPSEASRLRQSIVHDIRQSGPQSVARPEVSGLSKPGPTQNPLPPRRQRLKMSDPQSQPQSPSTPVPAARPVPHSTTRSVPPKSPEESVAVHREFAPRAARTTKAVSQPHDGSTPRRQMTEQASEITEKHELKRPELDEISPGRYKKKRSKTWLALREVLMVFIVAIAISALIKAFLIQAFIIPSESMEDTLLPQDRVLVSKLVPSVRQINRGDILVFEDTDNWLDTRPDTSPMSYVKRVLITLGLRPDDSQNHLIKRVIGLPGDHVQCCDKNGNIVVNGISVKEPYLKPGVAPSDISFDVYVPADKLWMMGDNRANSGDSRAHMESPSKGFVNVSSVTGRAFVIMWPYSRWKTLSNSNAFAAVPSLPK